MIKKRFFNNSQLHTSQNTYKIHNSTYFLKKGYWVSPEDKLEIYIVILILHFQRIDMEAIVTQSLI